MKALRLNRGVSVFFVVTHLELDPVFYTKISTKPKTEYIVLYLISSFS